MTLDRRSFDLGLIVMGVIALITLLFVEFALAGTLLIWPTVPEKPKIDLMKDAVTGEALESEREMTEAEILKVATYDAKQGNFATVQDSVKDVMTGRYDRVISRKGPTWSKEGTDYTIAYFADMRRIKGEMKPSGTVTVIDTKELGGVEWLRKNGYATMEDNELVEKDIPSS